MIADAEASKVKAIAPIGVSHHKIYVRAPIPAPLEIKLTGVNPGNATMKNAIKQSIQASLIERTRIAGTQYNIKRSFLERAIMNTVSYIGEVLIDVTLENPQGVQLQIGIRF